MKILGIFALMMGLVMVPGCKKKPKPLDDPVAVSPVVSAASEEGSEGEAEDSEDTEDSEDSENTEYAEGTEDSEDSEDLAETGETPGSGAPGAQQGGASEERFATDADIAEYREAKTRVDTQKAVNRSIDGVMPRLKGCFDQHGARAGDRQVSIRIHRSGRVLGSNISGVSDAVRSCVDRVLENLRVEGMTTDSITVERTFKYTRSGPGK